jgi:hypothetical protein
MIPGPETDVGYLGHQISVAIVGKGEIGTEGVATA